MLLYVWVKKGTNREKAISRVVIGIGAKESAVVSKKRSYILFCLHIKIEKNFQIFNSNPTFNPIFQICAYKCSFILTQLLARYRPLNNGVRNVN